MLRLLLLHMKNYALVTGASKGIGREISLKLAALGYPLLLVSRNEGELSRLSASIEERFKVKALFLAIDLAIDGSARNVAAWCTSNNYPVQILINNAGYGLWGDFEKIDVDGQLNMISLNISTLVALTYLLLPILKREQAAYVLNVASTAAYQAVPTLAVYAATKAFVLSFSRAIATELKHTNVSVSCLCPGPTDTGFAERAGMDAIKELAEKFNMSPDEVAKTAIKGMFKRKAEIVPGFLNKLSARAVSFVPKKLVETIAANLYKTPEQ